MSKTQQRRLAVLKKEMAAAGRTCRAAAKRVRALDGTGNHGAFTVASNDHRAAQNRYNAASFEYRKIKFGV